MTTFRQRLRELVARLDGVRERRAVAFGSLALFLALLAGPRTLRAVTALAGKVLSPVPSGAEIQNRNAGAPSGDPPRAADRTDPDRANAVPSSEPTAPLHPPSQPASPVREAVLTFLFPLPDATQAGPIDIGVRIGNATAVGVVFAVRDGAGNVRNLPAVPDRGMWDARFDGEPGPYAVSARAALDDGFVQAFGASRDFRLLPEAASGAPATGAEVRLLMPSEGLAAPFPGAIPLAAAVRGALPDAVDFIVRDATGAESVISASGTPDGGSWNAVFAGPDGAYDVRARAAGVEKDSERRQFVLKREP